MRMEYREKVNVWAGEDRKYLRFVSKKSLSYLIKSDKNKIEESHFIFYRHLYFYLKLFKFIRGEHGQEK